MNSLSILLVDKNPLFVQVVKQKLQTFQKPNVQVMGSSSQDADAVEQAHILQPRIILIGLEHQDLAPLRLIPRLRNVVPGVGIIALGALDLFAHQRVAFAAGVDAFVAKVMLDIKLLPTILNLAENVSINMPRPDLHGVVRMAGSYPLRVSPWGEWYVR